MSTVIFHLTDREQDIMREIVKGSKNYTIAVKLNLSEQTVKNQISSLMEKFGVSNRTALAVSVLSNYHKGQPCLYSEITCQEGFCSGCMIPLQVLNEQKLGYVEC